MAALSEEAQTRLAMAAFFVAHIRVLAEQDPSAVTRADEQLKALYYRMREWESSPIGTMEALTWASEMLREP